MYDVTKGGGFYGRSHAPCSLVLKNDVIGPGGPYAAFAGRDASRMLEKAQVKPGEQGGTAGGRYKERKEEGTIVRHEGTAARRKGREEGRRKR